MGRVRKINGHRPIKQYNLYGNCVMMSPDGEVMCRCDEYKAQWYLSRNLAKLIITNPLVFQLTFNPKAKGHAGNDRYSAFFLSEKENRCCVCGATEHLTRHHCVPYMYRKFLKDELKNHNSHDILMLCPVCHAKYERMADILKDRIAKETGIPTKGKKRTGRAYSRKITGLMYSILNFKDKIPADRLAQMKKAINKLSGKRILQSSYGKYIEATKNKKSQSNVPYGALVVKKIKNQDNFVRRWRRHFVKSMKPKFMPSYWHINNPVARPDWKHVVVD